MYPFRILLVFITVRLAQFNEYVNKSNLQTEDYFYLIIKKLKAAENIKTERQG